ncbi:MAG: hypothetical protein ACTSVY_14170 [Candidatus Helarchaeota archaeon]
MEFPKNVEEISFKKRKINLLLTILYVFITIIMIFLFIFIFSLVSILFGWFAIVLIIISSIIFISYVIFDEQCHLSSYAFWFSLIGNLILLISSSMNLFIQDFILLFVLSLVSISISSLLFYFRHEVDKVIILTLVRVEESFDKLDLKEIKTNIPLYRLKRAIQRGIRAEYLDPTFIIDKDILFKSPVLKISKDILYKKMQSPNTIDINGVHLNIYGLFLMAASFSWFLVQKFLSDFTFYLFGITFALGIFIVNYQAVQSLHHRKAVLIIEQWLRWKKEINLFNLGSEYGYMPIKYSGEQLMKIVKKYKNTGVLGNIEIKNNRIILIDEENDS